MSSPGSAGLADTVGDGDAFLERGPGASLESLCRDVVEQAPVGIAFINRDGGYRSCNRAFGELLGFSADDIAEQTLSSVTHAEDLTVSLEGFERLWRGETALLDFEKRCRRKDGGELWVRVSTSLLRGPQAAPECAVEFVRDISARRGIAAA